MATDDKPLQLKVYVDNEKKKVMFAEAEEDFVEILFSFMTLPLGTIARLLRNHADSKDLKLGSLTSLHQSVVNLKEKHFSLPPYKGFLDWIGSSSKFICKKLKVNVYESKQISGCKVDSEFLKSYGNFIITDDLNVVPGMLDTSIKLFNTLGVESFNTLEEKTVYFGSEEFLRLLKWSLLTNNPLTNMVFGGDKSSIITNSTSTSSALTSSNHRETQKVELLVQKSNGKLLCAQVERFFVELLFSFLTIPLGTFIRLTKDDSSKLGIVNLYNSISCLGDEDYLKSEDVKTMLLYPKLDYPRLTNFLPIYEANTNPGHYLKEHATFMVSKDLEVTTSSLIATVSNFNTLGIPIADMEVQEVSIGEHEALLLLKASLTSTSALTDCFHTFWKKPQVGVQLSGTRETVLLENS